MPQPTGSFPPLLITPDPLALYGAQTPPKPAAGEGQVGVGNSAPSLVDSAKFVGNGVKTTWVVQHNRGALVSVTVVKERGAGGSEPVPGKVVLIKEVKLLNENEVELVFETAPLAKETYWVQIDG
jgi:hypothetical protein